MKGPTLPRLSKLWPLKRRVAEKEAVAKVASAQLLALQEANIKKTLLLSGIGFLIVVTLLSQLLTPPPVGYKPPEAKSANAGTKHCCKHRPGRDAQNPTVLSSLDYVHIGAGAGLMIISMLTTIAKIGKIEGGFILVALLAVGNASGRILGGMLSDTIGRLWTMFIIFMFQAALMIVLRTGLTDMIAFIIVSMLIGFNYGACLSVFPSATKDNFGLKNLALTRACVHLMGCWRVSCSLSSRARCSSSKEGRRARELRKRIIMAATLLVVAAILTFVTRGVEQKTQEEFSGLSKRSRFWNVPLFSGNRASDFWVQSFCSIGIALPLFRRRMPISRKRRFPKERRNGRPVRRADNPRPN